MGRTKPTIIPMAEAIRLLNNKYVSMTMTTIIPSHSITLGSALLRYMAFEFAIIRLGIPINRPIPTPRPNFLYDFSCIFMINI